MKAKKTNVPSKPYVVRIYELGGDLEETFARGSDLLSLEPAYAEAVTLAMKRSKKDGVIRWVAIEQMLMSMVIE